MNDKDEFGPVAIGCCDECGIARKNVFLDAQLKLSRETSNQQTELIEALRAELSAAKERAKQFEKGCDSARRDEVEMRKQIFNLENCYSITVGQVRRLNEELEKERAELSAAKKRIEQVKEERVVSTITLSKKEKDTIIEGWNKEQRIRATRIDSSGLRGKADKKLFSYRRAMAACKNRARKAEDELALAKKRIEQFEQGCASARELLRRMGSDEVKLRERIKKLEEEKVELKAELEKEKIRRGRLAVDNLRLRYKSIASRDVWGSLGSLCGEGIALEKKEKDKLAKIVSGSIGSLITDEGIETWASNLAEDVSKLTD